MTDAAATLPAGQKTAAAGAPALPFKLIGGKLGDIWGRRTVFMIGVAMYGCGALITALSPSLPVMMFGWSLLEGLGSALMIPAIYSIIGSTFPSGKVRISAFAAAGAMAAMAP